MFSGLAKQVEIILISRDLRVSEEALAFRTKFLTQTRIINYGGWDVRKHV